MHASLTHPWPTLAAVMLQTALGRRLSSAWPAHPPSAHLPFARDASNLTARAEQSQLERNKCIRRGPEAQHWTREIGDA